VLIDSYVIILTSKNLTRHPPRKGVLAGGETRIETRFHIIRLWQLSAQKALASQRVALLPFVPLMRGGWRELEAGVAALRTVPNEAERREAALHFVMLGTLRYNRLDLLELIGRIGMIPLEQLRKHSSFYQFILEEGREEGRREAINQIFRQLVANRFPDLQLGAEVEAVSDLKQLEQLVCELNEIPDPETLRLRLVALSTPQN
jgi:predicted transposase YdaD